MIKEPRLKFTDEERADPELEKPIRKAEKAAAKADKAQKKIPQKTVRLKEHTVDPATGRAAVRLRFEEVEKKKPSSKVTHVLKEAPADTILGKVHQEIRSTEDENVGVESAHKTEQAAEAGTRIVREGYHSHKLKPYRQAARAEKELEKANVNVLYQKALRDDPQLASNPVSRWQQKRTIKKQYIDAKRAEQTGHTVKSVSQQTARAAQAVRKTADQAVQFVVRHKKGFLIAIAFLFMLSMFLSTMSSCSVMLESIGSAVAGSTYPSEDEEMKSAEAAYAAKEQDLQEYLDNYTSTHSYDEYHFDLDEIKHDPYVLTSILTAYHEGQWTLSEVQGTLQMLFEKQYTLTESVVKEVRYRTETHVDSEGNSYPVEVPYDYYICTVTLKNFDLARIPAQIMTEDQLSQYAVYMATRGNRPDLFPQSDYPNASEKGEYEDYDVPPEALEDETFAAMIQEAEKFLGYPYVWGGSNPSTSFDCSGFVSWVINHSGWDLGRLTAQGLCDVCTPVSSANVQPGDLVFFKGTYDTSGVSHVGIYVGDNRMIHCGDPISYTSIHTSYWQSHFYRYGRLP